MLENNDLPTQLSPESVNEKHQLGENPLKKYATKKVVSILLASFLILCAATGIFLIVRAGSRPATDTSNSTQKMDEGNQRSSLADQLDPLPSTFPSPVPAGSVTGLIKAGYYAKVIPAAKVTLSNDAGTFSGETDAAGTLVIEHIPVGTYTISTTHQEYTFPPSQVEITENNQTKIPTIVGTLTNPKPTFVNVSAYSDTNNNGQRDQNELSVAHMFSVSIKEGANWKQLYSFSTTKENSYSFKLLDFGQYTITALNQTFYTVPNPTQTLVVDGYGGPQKDFYFALKPTNAEFVTKLFVFNDKNENGTKDSDEEFVHYQSVEVKNNSTGKSYKVAVPPNGSIEHALEYGNYTVTLVPQDSSWAAYFQITKGQDNFTLESTTNKDTIVHLGAHKLY